MKNRLLSGLMSVVVLLGMVAVSTSTVDASSDEELIQVDGSYLTTEESSTGYSSPDFTRGLHMMDGECSITKAGLNHIYAYASTTANHDVQKVVVIVYVDQYNEEEERWGQIDCWMEEVENDFVAITSKTLKVDRGYYYRVHADHIVINEPDPPEETYSYTDGIWV